MESDTSKIEHAYLAMQYANQYTWRVLGGKQGDEGAYKSAYNALRMCGLSKGDCDRIAIRGWELSPTTWARARGVSRRSLGTNKSWGLYGIPEALLPGKFIV